MQQFIIVILISLLSTLSFSAEEKRPMYFDSDNTFFPTLFITDGHKILNPKNGVFPLKEAMRDTPKAFEAGILHEHYGRYRSWSTLATSLSTIALIIGAISESTALTWIGASGMGIGGTLTLFYHSKATYYLHKSINSYNREIKGKMPKPYGLQMSWSF